MDFDKVSQTDNFGQTESDRMDTMQDDIMSAREKDGRNQEEMNNKMKYMQTNSRGVGATASMYKKGESFKNTSTVTVSNNENGPDLKF